MRIVTDSIEVELYPEDLRHFNIMNSEGLRRFIDVVRIETKDPAGFKAKEKK